MLAWPPPQQYIDDASSRSLTIKRKHHGTKLLIEPGQT